MQDHPSASSVKVSVGQGVQFTKTNEISLAHIYNNFIRNPEASHVPAIKELREFVDRHADRLTAIEEVPESERTEEQKVERFWIKTNLNATKGALRAFTWSGLFSARNNEGLIEHSGRLQGDIDMKMLPRIFSEQLRDRLGEDPHIEVAFLSPSGRSVKVGILIPQCSYD